MSAEADRKPTHPQHRHCATFGLNYNDVVMVALYALATRYGNKLFFIIFSDATAQRRPSPTRKLIILRAVITKPKNPRNSVADKNLPNHFFVLSFCFFYYCPLFTLLFFCSFILSCFSFLCSFLLHLHLLFLLILSSTVLHSPFQRVKM